MLRVHLLLSLLFLLGCWADFQDNQKEDEEIIEKFDQLRARWNRLHPVTFPPPTAEETALFEKYANQKDDKDHIPSIVEINGAGGDRLIEGDIIPSEMDVAYLEERLHEDELAAIGSSNRSRRAASDITKENWPKDQPIPFAIETGYSTEHEKMIRTAVEIIEQNSCINFQENGPGYKLIYVDAGEKNGCQSKIGDARSNERDQYIALRSEGCMIMNTVIHETMHALGFGHTQMRADRDEYMDVIMSAIKKGKTQNFVPLRPHEFDNHSLPYEYNSNMHYPSTDFSIDEKTPVLIPKKRDYIGSVGDKHGMTFNDWKVLNIRYNCKDNCRQQNITCLNNGYQHPRECARCACPLFYTGQFCKIEVAPHFVLPDKEVKLNFESAEYTCDKYERDFAKFKKDVHLIKAPEGRRIRITLDRIESQDSNSCLRECVRSAVEIVDEDLTLVGKRFCCNNKTSTTFDSITNVVGYQVYSMPGWGFISNVTFSLVPTDEPQPVQTTTETSTTDKEEPTVVTVIVEPEITEGSGIVDETTEGSGITEEITEGSGITEEITEGSGVTEETTEGSGIVEEISEGSTTPSDIPTEVPTARESRIARQTPPCYDNIC